MEEEEEQMEVVVVRADGPNIDREEGRPNGNAGEGNERTDEMDESDWLRRLQEATQYPRERRERIRLKTDDDYRLAEELKRSRELLKDVAKVPTSGELQRTREYAEQEEVGLKWGRWICRFCGKIIKVYPCKGRKRGKYYAKIHAASVHLKINIYRCKKERCRFRTKIRQLMFDHAKKQHKQWDKECMERIYKQSVTDKILDFLITECFPNVDWVFTKEEFDRGQLVQFDIYEDSDSDDDDDDDDEDLFFG